MNYSWRPKKEKKKRRDPRLRGTNAHDQIIVIAAMRNESRDPSQEPVGIKFPTQRKKRKKRGGGWRW